MPEKIEALCRAKPFANAVVVENRHIVNLILYIVHITPCGVVVHGKAFLSEFLDQQRGLIVDNDKSPALNQSLAGECSVERTEVAAAKQFPDSFEHKIVLVTVLVLELPMAASTSANSHRAVFEFFLNLVPHLREPRLQLGVIVDRGRGQRDVNHLGFD